MPSRCWKILKDLCEQHIIYPVALCSGLPHLCPTHARAPGMCSMEMMCGCCPDISRTCYLLVWAGEVDQQGAREFGLSDTQVSPGVSMAGTDFALMVTFFFKFR